MPSAKSQTQRIWIKCGPVDLRTGEWTKLADRVRMLPTCVASCHRPLAQGRTSYLGNQNTGWYRTNNDLTDDGYPVYYLGSSKMRLVRLVNV